MTPKKLAAHYLRFWNILPHGTAELADNAPSEFWRFVKTLPPSVDRQVIFAALKSTAVPNDQVDVPDTPAMLRWLAARPEAVERADGLLSAKVPPKSLATLLRGAYLAEVQAGRVLVQGFLNGEIEKYK